MSYYHKTPDKRLQRERPYPGESVESGLPQESSVADTARLSVIEPQRGKEIITEAIGTGRIGHNSMVPA